MIAGKLVDPIDSGEAIAIVGSGTFANVQQPSRTMLVNSVTDAMR